jgi:Beta-propeller repeat
MPLSPEPGNTVNTAYNVGRVEGKSAVFNDSIGSTDTNDYFKFTLGSSASRLGVSLTGLSNDANLQVIRDANNNGIVDAGEVIGSSMLAGSAAELLNLTNLAAGANYYVRVYQGSGNTNYDLNFVADYSGDTIATARNIGIPPANFTQTYSDFVGNSGTGVTDTTDIYQFNVTTRSNLGAFLTGAGTNAQVQLLDANGVVLQNALNGFKELTPSQTIARILNPGTYFLRVTATGTNSTNYTLDVTTPPIASSLEWVRQFGTASNFDQSTDIAVDSLGNSYVVGYTTGLLAGDNAGFNDGFLSKYNANGTLQWTQEIETPTNDYVNAVAVDAAGNIYIGGQTQGTPINLSDAFIAKYNSAGTRQWLQLLGATSGGGGLAQVNDLALDISGNLYVTGRTANGGSSNFDTFTGKYSTSNAANQWFNRVGTLNSNAWDEGTGVAVDSLGSVYITGRTAGNLGGTNAGSYDAFLIKYGSTGAQQWIRQFGTTGNDEGTGVATDSTGNAYMTGNAGGTLGGTGSGTGFLTRFSSSGVRAWTTQFGAGLPTNSRDVKIDQAGNIYVAGTSQNSFGAVNYTSSAAYFLRFNTSGVVQQGTNIGNYASSAATGLAIDAAGNVYLSGTTFGTLDGVSAYGTDIFIAKF